MNAPNQPPNSLFNGNAVNRGAIGSGPGTWSLSSSFANFGDAWANFIGGAAANMVVSRPGGLVLVNVDVGNDVTGDHLFVNAQPITSVVTGDYSAYAAIDPPMQQNYPNTLGNAATPYAFNLYGTSYESASTIGEAYNGCLGQVLSKLRPDQHAAFILWKFLSVYNASSSKFEGLLLWAMNAEELATQPALGVTLQTAGALYVAPRFSFGIPADLSNGAPQFDNFTDFSARVLSASYGSPKPFVWVLADFPSSPGYEQASNNGVQPIGGVPWAPWLVDKWSIIGTGGVPCDPQPVVQPFLFPAA